LIDGEFALCGCFLRASGFDFLINVDFVLRFTLARFVMINELLKCMKFTIFMEIRFYFTFLLVKIWLFYCNKTCIKLSLHVTKFFDASFYRYLNLANLKSFRKIWLFEI